MGRAERTFILALGRRTSGADSNVPCREISLWCAFDFTDVHISDRFASLAFLVLVAMVLALEALLNTYCLIAGNALSLSVKETTALKTVTFPSQILARDALRVGEKVSEALRAKCLISDCRATTTWSVEGIEVISGALTAFRWVIEAIALEALVVQKIQILTASVAILTAKTCITEVRVFDALGLRSDRTCAFARAIEVAEARTILLGTLGWWCHNADFTGEARSKVKATCWTLAAFLIGLCKLTRDALCSTVKVKTALIALSTAGSWTRNAFISVDEEVVGQANGALSTAWPVEGRSARFAIVSCWCFEAVCALLFVEKTRALHKAI